MKSRYFYIIISYIEKIILFSTLRVFWAILQDYFYFFYYITYFVSHLIDDFVLEDKLLTSAFYKRFLWFKEEKMLNEQTYKNYINN